MSEIDNTALAGAGDDGLSPVMSMEAAAEFLDKLDAQEGDEEKNQALEADGEITQADEAAGDELDGGSADADDAGQEGEPEESSFVDFDALKPDTKLRLRDGTEFTLADVKKNWDALRNVQKREAEIQTRESEISQRSTQAAQHEQIFSQTAPLAFHILQQSLPKIPEPPSLEKLRDDPMQYQEDKFRHEEAVKEYNAKIGQMRQIQQAEHARQVKLKADHDASFQHYVQEQSVELFKKAPDLRDKAKMESFVKDVSEHGAAYGFKPDELDIHDHRVVMVVRDAIAYRKLKSKPPTPTTTAQKTAGPAPVVPPGRRGNGAEAQSQSRNDLQRKANAAAQKGDLQLAAKLYSQLEDT